MTVGGQRCFSMLCDDSLKAQIRRNLGTLDVRRADPGTHRIAAVAVAVAEEGEGAHLEGLADPVGWSREAALILTRRASDLRDHPGQWALPGGQRRCRRVRGRDGVARTGRGGRAGARCGRRARPSRRLHHPLRLRDHAGGRLGRRGDGICSPIRRRSRASIASRCTSSCAAMRRCSTRSPTATIRSCACRSERAGSPPHRRRAVPVPRALHRRPADPGRTLRAAPVRPALSPFQALGASPRRPRGHWIDIQ